MPPSEPQVCACEQGPGSCRVLMMYPGRLKTAKVERWPGGWRVIAGGEREEREREAREREIRGREGGRQAGRQGGRKEDSLRDTCKSTLTHSIHHHGPMWYRRLAHSCS